MSDTPIYDNIGTPAEPEPEKWWQKFLTPTFRRWAYGVSAAAVTVGATLAGKPEFIAVIAPLIMALFFVTNDGEPK